MPTNTTTPAPYDPDPLHIAYAAWHDAIGATAHAILATAALPVMVWLGTLGGGDQS